MPNLTEKPLVLDKTGGYAVWLGSERSKVSHHPDQSYQQTFQQINKINSGHV